MRDVESPQIYAGTPATLAERRAKPGWEFTLAARGLMKEMENQGHPPDNNRPGCG